MSKITEYLETVTLSEVKASIPRGGQIDLELGQQIIKNFSEKTKLDEFQALLAMAFLFQTGGTNKSCDGNLETEIFSKKIKLSTLRSSLRECKLKGGERKLARLYGTEIFEICQKFKIPGNLYKRSSRLNPGKNISEMESYWLSDFQIDNPDCPVGVTSLIQQVFDDRKNNNSKKK